MKFVPSVSTTNYSLHQTEWMTDKETSDNFYKSVLSSLIPCTIYVAMLMILLVSDC